MLHRTARQAAPTYTALCQQVRESPAGIGDRLAGRRRGCATGCGPSPRPRRRSAIRSGRGFDDLLGTDFAGVLVRDRVGVGIAASPTRCTRFAGERGNL